MQELITIDMRGIYEKLASMPEPNPGAHKHQWINEEDWIIWTLWERRKKSDVARMLKCGRESVRNRFNELKEQGGPKGKRPEWMK